jgi:sodium/potassium-transporting ATPase subunit alpha
LNAGDGVNDSPAIKKANIGIAMGSGADVAKDAADMLLLNDDFTSIVNGIKEGRLIFDNLKKSIAYTLSSNIPEIAPFLFFIIFQVPLPLSTVLILCIDLGTDMVPAISLAYENPELDIMERRPRNAQMDHLVNAKLISFSYLQVGIVQASAGFYTYFVVMSDYGFSPSHLFFFALREGCVGNEALRQYKWTNNQDSDLDIRKFYANCPRVSWDEPYKKYSYYRKESDTRDTISSVSDAEIRYTSEALRYAQCSYLISIIIVQWADILICKTRKLSIAQQGMRNHMLNFGLCFETGLGALLCYVPWVQRPLGTRPLEIRHFGIPSFPFFIVIFFYDELRKFALRRKNKNEYDYEGEEQEKLIPEHATSLQKDADKNWIYRNTYY